jgi:hypothetical protein
VPLDSKAYIFFENNYVNILDGEIFGEGEIMKDVFPWRFIRYA